MSKRIKDEYSKIYGNSVKNLLIKLSSLKNTYVEEDSDYEAVYDTDGDYVICDECGGVFKFKNGSYICPDCKNSMNRLEFYNYAGIDVPGDECLECDSEYPGCIACPYGYTE